MHMSKGKTVMAPVKPLTIKSAPLPDPEAHISKSPMAGEKGESAVDHKAKKDDNRKKRNKGR